MEVRSILRRDFGLALLMVFLSCGRGGGTSGGDERTLPLSPGAGFVLAGADSEAKIEGWVISDGGGGAVVGAFVAAQIYDPTAADEAYDVVVEAVGLTDESGYFELILAPNSYNLVVTREGYGVAAMRVEVGVGEAVTRDFSLVEADCLRMSGSVIIPDASVDARASVSLRQEVILGDLPEVVEVWSEDVPNKAEFSARLPAGDYEIVVSTEGRMTLVSDVKAGDDEAIRADVTF